MKLGIICNASFTTTGTFTPVTSGPSARPIDPIDQGGTGLPITGCWPVGTWTFTAKVDTNDCPTAPAVLPSYSFKVDRKPDPEAADPATASLLESYVNLTSLSDMQWHVAVSSNGGGCEGNFELGTADGKEYWHMQPTLLNPTPRTAPPTTTITGSGDYALYNGEAWPWK